MFYLKPTRNKQWRWCFIASNGQVSASTEKFPSRSNAKRAALSFAIAAAKVLMPDVTIKYSLKDFQMLEWNQRPGK